MAKKVLYLGNSKWCWTERCTVHAATIQHKNSYLKALADKNEKEIAVTRAALLSTPEGISTYNHLTVSKLAQALGRRPNIGLDLDGTTGDFTGGLRSHRAKGLKLSKEEWLERLPDPTEYAMWKGPNAWYKDREDFLSNFSQAEAEGIYRALPVFDNAPEILKELKNYGFNIKVITARGAIFNTDTRSWINTHKIPTKTVLNYGLEKERAKDIDVYIDDAPEVISRLIANKKKVVIMNHLYNESIDPHDSSRRVKSWDADIVKAIFDLVDEKQTLKNNRKDSLTDS